MQKERIIELITEFSKTVNQYNKLYDKPFDFGTDEKLYPAEIHMIQAIGDKCENTVTELGRSFGVTKGAVSQVVGKLERKGYVTRERNPAYSKEIFLSLTEKGWKAYRGHEYMHGRIDDDFWGLVGGFTEEENAVFEKMLLKIEKYIDVFMKD